jgi:hypothetical protein
MSVVDLGATILAVGSRTHDSGPPPVLKVERRGGSGMLSVAVDPGALI